MPFLFAKRQVRRRRSLPQGDAHGGFLSSRRHVAVAEPPFLRISGVKILSRCDFLGVSPCRHRLSIADAIAIDGTGLSIVVGGVGVINVEKYLGNTWVGADDESVFRTEQLLAISVRIGDHAFGTFRVVVKCSSEGIVNRSFTESAKKSPSAHNVKTFLQPGGSFAIVVVRMISNCCRVEIIYLESGKHLLLEGDCRSVLRENTRRRGAGTCTTPDANLVFKYTRRGEGNRGLPPIDGGFLNI